MAGRSGKPGRGGGPPPRTGRGHNHASQHVNQTPAPLSTQRDRHRQPDIQQQPFPSGEAGSAAASIDQAWQPQQQQVQLLQRSDGSKHAQADAAPNGVSGAHPEQTRTGEPSGHACV